MLWLALTAGNHHHKCVFCKEQLIGDEVLIRKKKKIVILAIH